MSGESMRVRLPGAIWALGLVSLCMDMSSEMIHALLPVFMVSVLGVGVAAVGWVEGIAEATAAIVKLYAGVLSDRLGRRKPLALLGYGLAALTKPLFPLAGSLGTVLAARFIDRIGKGIRGAPRDALVAALAPPALRGAAFGLRQSLDTAGAFIGPALGLWLMLVFAGDFRAVFWVAVVPAFAAVAVLALGVREPAPVSPSPASSHGWDLREARTLGPAYRRVLLIGAVFTLARFSEAFLVLRGHALGLPDAQTPWVLIALNAAYMFSAYPAGALSDRLPRERLLGWGLILLVVADVVLALAADWTALFAGIAVWGLHLGFTQGLLAALVADTAPPQRHGAAFGLFHLVTGIALLLASLLAGWLWEAWGPEATFAAGAGWALAAWLLLLRRPRDSAGG
ncbi:Predicted arabinose efflux permease, MFS family [Fontimonas thermophila]|uniref:Predicted arabinose efflux permease, MFS family n=1 Tax=Fontimonas thermophila TaxID=1076937 RepID=A0A1I2ICT6_9GAMM|nr:MFS transporter [Fontimonas thermophila]SFF38917.1 Predicted arabinose efflux permease, MFS family [Fontimonas thermophila]